VIKDGLIATDRVVVNGQMHARPGIKVNAREVADPAAPPPTSGDEARAGSVVQ
jgi:hypothetical protein